MDKRQELWAHFHKCLTGLESTEVTAYEQPRERTKLMLGNSADRSTGLIQRAIAAIFTKKGTPGTKSDGEWSYERYHDAAWGGEDYPACYEAGNAYNQVIAEVENGPVRPDVSDYGQVQKLVNWLMNTQAHYKWAVLYYDLKGMVNRENIATYAEAIKGAVADVVDKFSIAGLVESAETRYLISLGPTSLHPEDCARGWIAFQFEHAEGKLKGWKELST